MADQTTFSKSRLNGRIYPLTYSVRTKYDVNALFFTVAGVEDVYGFIRDKLNAYLYIFDVGHHMEQGGIYLTLREILENMKIEPDHVYEDDIIAVKKEKFGKFLKFPQHDLKMFDHDRLMEDDEFAAFYRQADARLKDLDVFLNVKSRLPGYFINCHDNSLMYCETRDLDLKGELLRKMLHDYFAAYLDKNHKISPDISVPDKAFADELFDKWDKLAIREEATRLKNNEVDAAVFDGENKEGGTLVYKIDKKEWSIKYPG